ncbi:MAG: pentapeptide repeat-containing protein, partial [Pseudomonadota bacterium]
AVGAVSLRWYIPMPGLPGARLADFCGDRSSFHGCRFARVDATDASFEFADLSAAVFDQAVLREVSMIGAELEGADFSGADLTGADLNWTAFDRDRAPGARLDHARLGNVVRIAYGPAGVEPPHVAIRPMFPDPIGAADLAAKAIWRPRARSQPAGPSDG